jgi:hypothetical protein
VYPTRIERCEHGGWRDFRQFKDEDDCKAYIAELSP